MLVERFKKSYGKSTRGLKLYDHCLGTAEICLWILDKFGLDYPKDKKDMLIFSAFCHDIGKLDEDFQKMLIAVIKGLPLPPKRVKHEASTLDFKDLLEGSVEDVKTELAEKLGYKITSKIDIEMVLAFAVSHHGLFYISYESTRNYGDKWLIRREWTTRNLNEKERITLTDLLFLYYPFGGAIMAADLMHSFCHEKEINYKKLLKGAKSYNDILEKLIEEADRLEEILNKDEPRANRSIQNLLKLLLGGV